MVCKGLAAGLDTSLSPPQHRPPRRRLPAGVVAPSTSTASAGAAAVAAPAAAAGRAVSNGGGGGVAGDGVPSGPGAVPLVIGPRSGRWHADGGDGRRGRGERGGTPVEGGRRGEGGTAVRGGRRRGAAAGGTPTTAGRRWEISPRRRAPPCGWRRWLPSPRAGGGAAAVAPCRPRQQAGAGGWRARPGCTPCRLAPPRRLPGARGGCPPALPSAPGRPRSAAVASWSRGCPAPGCASATGRARGGSRTEEGGAATSGATDQPRGRCAARTVHISYGAAVPRGTYQYTSRKSTDGSGLWVRLCCTEAGRDTPVNVYTLCHEKEIYADGGGLRRPPQRGACVSTGRRACA